MKTIDWARPLRPVGDYGYTILVNAITGDVVIGALVDKTGKELGLLTWDRTTGVPMAAGRGFPFSAWRAENVPLDPADSAETIESVRAKFDAYRRLPKRALLFSLDDVHVLLQAIADRDEVLVRQRPACGKGKHNIGANGMCVLCGLAGWEY